MGHQQGDYVAIEFVSANASATNGGNVTLKDANQVTRTLKSYERLLIDRLEADIASSITADVYDDLNANKTVDAGELIASFSPTATLFEAGHEGFSVSQGNTPAVLSSASGSVKISGTGRIILSTCQGAQKRPDWQCDLTGTGDNAGSAYNAMNKNVLDPTTKQTPLA